ncbi:MAG TPA: hydrolase [Thermoanaerobaculia bacterium]|nr:hydrolase [Thermoanaerobaculia bacterium]
MRRLRRENAILAIIDVQERLAAVIEGIELVQSNLERLIRGCHIIGAPALVTEQYPRGLGETVASLRKAIAETSRSTPIRKMCFSSQGCAEFADALRASGRRQVLLAGIEAHVCVWQTAVDLLDAGYEVHVVADAVSSRSARNRDIALRRLEQEGAKLTSTEMALFEMTVEAGTEEFRAISRLVK